jgi:hypothetical protein
MKKLTRREAIGAMGRAAGSAAVLTGLPLGATLMPAQAEKREAVHVTRSADSVEIENGLVKARFTTEGARVGHEYFARNPNGSWKMNVPELIRVHVAGSGAWLAVPGLSVGIG